MPFVAHRDVNYGRLLGEMMGPGLVVACKIECVKISCGIGVCAERNGFPVTRGIVYGILYMCLVCMAKSVLLYTTGGSDLEYIGIGNAGGKGEDRNELIRQRKGG